MSRWDDRDRFMWRMAQVSTIALYILIAAMMLSSMAISCTMVLETEAVARAAFMAGRRMARDWPLCWEVVIPSQPDIPKPFDPRQVPI